VVDEPVRERRDPERVQARADDRADLRQIELEGVDRVDRATQQLVLDLRRATLQAELEQVVAELQRAALDARAREDALRELIVVELQAVERVGLVELVRLVGGRQGGDPRALAARSATACDDRSRDRRGPAGLRVGSDGRGS
jgi:translation initiation factor IF-2